MSVHTTLSHMGRFRRWLFEVGTRIVELLNALLLVSFSSIMALNYFNLLSLPSYARFDITQAYHWLFVLGLGVAQLVAMCRLSNRSNQVSGLLLLFSGTVWLIIAAIFSANAAHVMTTAVTTYVLVALACLLAGYELLTINRLLEDDKAHGSN